MSEILRAAWVIARRDFTAHARTKAFAFFLMAPLIFVVVAMGMSTLESNAAETSAAPVIGMFLPPGDANRMVASRDTLEREFDVEGLPRLASARCTSVRLDQAADLLGCTQRGGRYQAIISGSLKRPILTGSGEDVGRWRGKLALILDFAHLRHTGATAPLVTHIVARTQDRSASTGLSTTAQAAQGALFMLTLMLSGMLLSNLVEEKTGKILEILAASVPIDAIFVGKLLAIFGIALIAIIMWSISGAALQLLFPVQLPDLSRPAMGWPLFLMLAACYFTTAYMLVGALFLGVGSVAGTMREVQTLSMPLSLAQLAIFLLAGYATNSPGHAAEFAAVAFPFSSPFAMLARAAQNASLLPHLFALTWQALWVPITICSGSRLFRRNVLRSGRNR